MSAGAICGGFWPKAACMGLFMFLTASARAAVGVEQTFPVLQIGTQFYTNATVTTHSKDYVFIIHSRGMANIKVASLGDETLEKLGYITAAQRAQIASTNSVIARAKTKVAASLQPEELKNLKQSWMSHLPKTIPSPRTLRLEVLLVCCSVLLLLHLFFSYCCKCICEKAGVDAGPAIWIPILQIVPMLRAAGMATAWFLAFLVPGLNLLAQIIWSFKIVQARGKSPVVAVGLILPVTNVLTFLYLAFSSGAAKPEKRGPEIMTLEAI